MFKVEEIKKSFKDKEVLKGVSFSVEEGDRVALLGNNGAGKSTLFKIISGQLIANSGSVSTKLDFQTEIGMMPQGDILIDDLTTGMDLESVDNFWKLLDEQKFTSVIVTHDFNQIDHFFTKVLILKDGRIAASDAVDKIHADGKTIEQYYRENVEKEA